MPAPKDAETRVDRLARTRLAGTGDPAGAPSGERLGAVLRICQRLTSERDFPALLDLIVKETARLVEADRASIFLLDSEKRELVSQVALGSDRPLRFDARLGIAGAAALSGETINVADTRHDPRFYPGIDARSRYRTRNLLAVPLRALDGEAIGAFEVLNKKRGPFGPEDVEVLTALAAQAAIAIQTARIVEHLQREREELAEENETLRLAAGSRAATAGFLGTSVPIQRIVRTIEQIAPSAVSVLITGESGTGKELVARAIHAASARARGPFVALNCAALPENLVEAELFGIEKGVATGVDARIGRIEQAQGGTLFLDEIGDLALASQAKILRALEERVIERVGGRRSVSVDVRILAATNQDLEAEIRQHRFREDLFYRLNVVPIRMPSLREISVDIPLLANSFLRKLCREARETPKALTPEAVRLLVNYGWPGNVRELENEMKRIVACVRGTRVQAGDLSDTVREARASGESHPGPARGAPAHDGRNHAPGRSASVGVGAGGLRSGAPLQAEVAALERRLVEEALRACGGNQLQAARALGLSRQGLINKIRRYGIAIAAR